MRNSLFNTTFKAKFTASYRLLHEVGFEHVVHAEKITGKHIRIFFVRNEKKNARLGIVASKRIIAGAVQRNRVKREIREAFRQHSIKAEQIDLVVMVRGVDIHESQRDDLKTLFSRIKDKCAG